MTNSDTVPTPFEHAIRELEHAVSALSLTDDVANQSALFYEDVFANELYNGRQREVTLAGVLFLACREKDTVVTPSSLAEHFGITQRELLSTSRYLSRRLNINRKPVDWRVYVDWLCDELDTDESYREVSYQIAQCAVSANELSGRSPRSFAAGAVYAAGQLSSTRNRFTQEQVSNLSDLSKVTIRKTYKDQLQSYRERQ